MVELHDLKFSHFDTMTETDSMKNRNSQDQWSSSTEALQWWNHNALGTKPPQTSHLVMVALTVTCGE